MDAQIPPLAEQLALLARIVRGVTRSRRMLPEDAEDFAQSVQLKLIERDYEVFHRFAGRSSLATYLTVVVERMLLDWQNSMYGKWRPSSAAVRLGEEAVDLERLVGRDKHSVDEAIELLVARGSCPNAPELRRLAEQLPMRLHRSRVTADALGDRRSVEFDDPLVVRERARAQARIRATLAQALAGLSSDDRRLLALRYWRRRTVQSVAKRMKQDPKRLYRRFDRVLRSLRRSLAEHGVTGPSMIESTEIAGSAD